MAATESSFGRTTKIQPKIKDGHYSKH